MSFGKENVTRASHENLPNIRNKGSFTHQNNNDKNPTD